jgi:uncharacterized membrane protein (UPF0127 family)
MESGYIFIEDNVFPTLLAISADEQSKGLMFEKFPPPIMSFIYTEPQINKFWMKNTPSPLDIIFCCDGEIKQICVGEPYSTQTIGGDNPSNLVIELPFGIVHQSVIKLGNKVGFIAPTELELKKIIAKKYNKFVKF